MERENMFMNETNNFLLPYSMAMQNEQHGTSQQLQDCLFNPNWDNSVDQNATFESALSSMVSSPVTSHAGERAFDVGRDISADTIVLRELIGRLGSISNSCEASPHSYMNGNDSTNNSGYSTPLNSPPKLNLAMIPLDGVGPMNTTSRHQIRGSSGNLPFSGSHLPGHASLGPMEPEPGFAEKAARYSCFANNDRRDTNKDVSSLQEEKSSVSEQIPGGKYGNLRKRKLIPKGKGKDAALSTSCEEANGAAEKNELSAKRSKSDDNKNGKDGELKGDKNGNKKGNKDDQKPSEPLKDYIHVRARRGQATDAHSLAERVRREKISQRMKFLQDLVPGCNKVTGKAVMLDEIINYVQSLQRQVEFLSMKLATINPGMDVDIEALLSSKDMLLARGTLPSGTHSTDTPASVFPFHFQCQQVPNLHGATPNEAEMPLLPRLMDADTSRSQSMQVPLGNYNEHATQASSVWGDDLQSVVFGQNEMHNPESEYNI